MKIRRVALIGMGAIGSFFVPNLMKYLPEGDFTAVADGARRERLETNGISVNDEVYRPQIIAPGEAMIDEEGREVYPDLIIVAVKYMQLPQAIEDIRKLVGPETLILSVLNGIDSEEQIAAVYGWNHVLYSYMRVSIVMKNGVTHRNPKIGAVYFGEKMNADADGNPVYSERVLAVKELMDAAGIRYRIGKDMLRGIWLKYMSNVGENLTCALLGIPFGAYRYSVHANWIRVSAMREVAAVAQRKGISLTEKDIDTQNQQVLQIAPENKPSTLQDIEAGRKTEVDMFAGGIMKLGQQFGISTPVCEMLYHGIHALEDKTEMMNKHA